MIEPHMWTEWKFPVKVSIKQNRSNLTPPVSVAQSPQLNEALMMPLGLKKSWGGGYAEVSLAQCLIQSWQLRSTFNFTFFVNKVHKVWTSQLWKNADGYEHF